jgi:lipopolysaccharide export LptBFGC system permease protein LptF
MAGQPRHLRTLVYLVPQALPLALPIGVMVGILCGFRGRLVSVRSTRSVLALAVAGAAIAFAVLAWLMPAANQSFREAIAQVAPGTLAKGLNEMTITELGAAIQSYRHAPMEGSPLVHVMFAYHQRWSLACATAILAPFAIGVLACRPSSRWIVGGTALGACLAYYVLLFLGRSAVLSGTAPAFAGAWLPNVVFVLLSALLLMIVSDRRLNRSLVP